MSHREHKVADPEALRDGECRVVRAGSIEIGVYRVGGGYRAWRNVCPHAGAPVCRGTVEGTVLPSRVYEYLLDDSRPVLRCPWHGWEYDLETGEHLTDASTRLQGYPVVERSDGVYLLLPVRAGAGSARTRTRDGDDHETRRAASGVAGGEAGEGAGSRAGRGAAP